MAHHQPGLRHNWDLVAVAAAAVLTFIGALFGLAAYVDGLALQREQLQLHNALDGSIQEAAERITGVSNWDDAVLHLDNTFDPSWTTKNIGQYFFESVGLPLSYVLRGDDRPVFGMADGHSLAPDSYSRFAAAAAPLIAGIRVRELKRGPFVFPFKAAGDISRPIQASAIVRANGSLFVLIASLVQPDAGKALPRGRRAPILVNGEPVDQAFLKKVEDRLLVKSLKLVSVNRSTSAEMDISDAKGHVVGRLEWTPHQPGAYLISVSFLPILLAVGFPLGLYLRSRATSRRLTTALAELSRARDAAIAANQTKTQFLANMSHELRTPLNAILGFSELLTLAGFAGKRAEYASLIHNSGAHLLGLVDDLLDLSRIEAGKVELHFEVVDLAALIGECADIVEPRAQDAGLRIIRSIDPALPSIVADTRAMKQILLNLLTNAIKFTPPGGSVELFGRIVQTGELVLGVKDTGIGIAEEDQARVFERFGQGRHEICTPEKGAGLGLPIVKGLAEAQGGKVTLESHLESGTCVTIRFPKDRLKSADTNSEKQRASQADIVAA